MDSKDVEPRPPHKMIRGDGKSRMDTVEAVAMYGQQDQGNLSTIGKNLALNPSWVLQLMGTTIEKTFSEWREMES